MKSGPLLLVLSLTVYTKNFFVEEESQISGIPGLNNIVMKFYSWLIDLLLQKSITISKLKLIVM